MRRGIFVVVAVGVLAFTACAGLVRPVVDPRVTTEIHGIPPIGSAHVQNQRFLDYPFDGSVVKLFDVNIEVDDPPPGNHVQFVGTVTPLGRSGQRVRMSFFGPNAMDDIPIDDEPIFVDLFGTYTDSDNPNGPVTGPIDLFDIGGTLFWAGIDASALFVDPDSVHVSIVDVDGGTTDIAFGEHPLSFSVVDVGDPNENLRGSLGSSVFFPPWVPELVETADEVHFFFDVYLPGPGTLTRLGPAQKIFTAMDDVRQTHGLCASMRNRFGQRVPREARSDGVGFLRARVEEDDAAVCDMPPKISKGAVSCQ